MDTEVLIIGAGPTGLMMACQLLRFGINFRIIDQQKDRTHESRAFSIQARSMEIFQNLGLAAEFLKVVHLGMNFVFFINGKKQAEIILKEFQNQDSPFPSVYSLPQSETERILIQFLEKHDISIEREKELIVFQQDEEAVKAIIKDHTTAKTAIINCAYILGCDGAHSAVRHILKLPFEGSTYQQAFILVDAHIKWSFPSNQFLFFSSKQGILVHIPLGKSISRMMLARHAEAALKETMLPPSLTEVEQAASLLAASPVQLSQLRWLSQFRLHHRGVTSYYQGRAFLVGDAAHIHSPIGGQGMNTGIQDSTNLAWKLALVLKKGTSTELLHTYEVERHRVGKILLKTTDRFFSFLTAKNFFVSQLRRLLLPSMVSFLFSKKRVERYLFWFMSQLNIHYPSSSFCYEVTRGSDVLFKQGPSAGYRAPDAPAHSSTLFELTRVKPINIFFFQSVELQATDSLEKLEILEKDYKDWIQVHHFIRSATHDVLFKRYGVASSAIYLIRPDGYIGFRSYGYDWVLVDHYVRKLLKKID